LKRVFRAPGRIDDIKGERVLFHNGNDTDTGPDYYLSVTNRSGEAEFRSPYTPQVHKAFLTRYGAIFLGTERLDNNWRVYELDATGQKRIGDDLSMHTLRGAGNFVTFTGSDAGLFRQNSDTRVTEIIHDDSDAYGTGDVGANGMMAYTKNTTLYFGTTLITNGVTTPITDGTNIVYGYSPGSGRAIMLHSAGTTYQLTPLHATYAYQSETFYRRSSDFWINGGWVLFRRANADNSFQAFKRSPQGEITTLTGAGDVEVYGINSVGSAIWRVGGTFYWDGLALGELPKEFTRFLWESGKWQALIGGSIFEGCRPGGAGVDG
jgi:hypothetical protein